MLQISIIVWDFVKTEIKTMAKAKITSHSLSYKFKKIAFNVKFELEYPPKQYRDQMAPEIKNMTIFHRGEKVNAIISQELSMDLVLKIHKKYCKLPNKLEK